MNIVARVAAFGLATVACLSLHAIEKHARLGAQALAIMALQTPAPRHRDSRIPNGIIPSLVEGEAAPDAPNGNARFEAGRVNIEPGKALMVIEDREARVIVYIYEGNVAAVRVPPETCEAGTIARPDLMARAERNR